MTKFIEHIAGEYKDGLQQCVLCGAVIIDDRGMIGPSGQPPSKGYDPGPVQISDGNPRITTVADMSERYSVVKCNHPISPAKEAIEVCGCGRTLVQVLSKDGKKIGVTHETIEDEEYHSEYFASLRVQEVHPTKEPAGEKLMPEEKQDWEHLLEMCIYTSLLGYTEPSGYSIPCKVREDMKYRAVERFKKELTERGYAVAKSPSATDPGPLGRREEVPAEIHNWIRSEYDKPENAAYNFDEFKYGAIAMYEFLTSKK